MQLAYTCRDAAALLDISESAVRRLITQGHLATVPHLGRTVRIAHAELERFTGPRPLDVPDPACTSHLDDPRWAAARHEYTRDRADNEDASTVLVRRVHAATDMERIEKAYGADRRAS